MNHQVMKNNVNQFTYEVSFSYNTSNFNSVLETKIYKVSEKRICRRFVTDASQSYFWTKICILHGLLSWSQFNELQDRQEYAILDPANHDDHGQLGGDDLRHYGGETDHINHGFRTIMNPTKQRSARSKCRDSDIYCRT